VKPDKLVLVAVLITTLAAVAVAGVQSVKVQESKNTAWGNVALTSQAVTTVGGLTNRNTIKVAVNTSGGLAYCAPVDAGESTPSATTLRASGFPVTDIAPLTLVLKWSSVLKCVEKDTTDVDLRYLELE